MKIKNRWVILGIAFLANLIVGSAYAWGVLSVPLRDEFGFTTAQTGLAFSFALGLIAIWMTLSGKIIAKVGPQPIIFVGGLAAGASWILSSFITDAAWTMFVYYGVIGSIGIGLVYGTCVPTALKWFPDKRGLAGGIIVGGFGGGAVVFAEIFRATIAAWGIQQTFLNFGIAFIIIVPVAALFISPPPEGYVPAGFTPPKPAAGATPSTSTDLTATDALKTGRFWILLFIFAFSLTGGIGIIGQAGNIALHRLDATPGQISMAVLFLGAANTLGRIIWGLISDKIGRNISLGLMIFISVASFLLLLTTNPNTVFPLFIIYVMGVGQGFGGVAGVFPAITAENFGITHTGAIFGLVFFGFTIAAFAGPTIQGSIFDHMGSHNGGLIFSAITGMIAIVLTVILVQAKKKALGKAK
ncbi:MAG: MFS transporter [Defluviitaleaceae bacterium]|nr:MFS transporter [Defluviitaleaceae bacterium]